MPKVIIIADSQIEEFVKMLSILQILVKVISLFI